MPEPDIVLTSWRGDRDVSVETVALVVEVADTTLSIDLGRKLALYASAGVAEYWVVDVDRARVLIHHQPRSNGYDHHREEALGDRIAAATIAGLVIDTASVV